MIALDIKYRTAVIDDFCFLSLFSCQHLHRCNAFILIGESCLPFKLVTQNHISNQCNLLSGLSCKLHDVQCYLQVVGSDEDNFPLTRQVQKDVWIHQHPPNCNDPNLKFLLADWETLPGFGIGAQLAGMSGLLAIAINENRILVANYYNRADHSGCKGVTFVHCYNYCTTIYEIFATFKKKDSIYIFMSSHIVYDLTLSLLTCKLD